VNMTYAEWAGVGPGPAQPDPSLEDPEPARFDSVEVGRDGRTLSIAYVRGPHRRLHHVEVRPGQDAVELSVYLGLAPWAAKQRRRSGQLFIRPLALHERTEVRLQEPVGGRTIVDASINPSVSPGG